MPLSAARKLYLLEAFPSLAREEDFAYADTIESDIMTSMSAATASPEKFVMDYASAMRRKSLTSAEPEASLRSGDLFKYVVANLAQMAAPPEDVTLDDMLEFFSLFEDRAVMTAPHAFYLSHMYSILDHLSSSKLLEEDLSQDARNFAVCIINSHMSGYLNIDAATTPAHSPAPKEKLGQTISRNVRIDGRAATVDHEIAADMDLSVKEIIAICMHKINHTYQISAHMAFLTYNMQVAEMTNTGMPLDQAMESLRKIALRPDLDTPFMMKRIYASAEFRFFATYMNLSLKIYPEDPAADSKAYVLNPMELQAFHVSDKAADYIAATPEQRAELHRQAESILKNHDAVERARAALKASLQKDIAAQPASIAPSDESRPAPG